MTETVTEPIDAEPELEVIKAKDLSGNHIGRIFIHEANHSKLHAPIAGIEFDESDSMNLTLLVLGEFVTKKILRHASIRLDPTTRVQL